jgi:hypothetical protein
VNGALHLGQCCPKTGAAKPALTQNCLDTNFKITDLLFVTQQHNYSSYCMNLSSHRSGKVVQGYKFNQRKWGLVVNPAAMAAVDIDLVPRKQQWWWKLMEAWPTEASHLISPTFTPYGLLINHANSPAISVFSVFSTGNAKGSVKNWREMYFEFKCTPS